MTRIGMVRTIKITASLAAIVLGLSFPCGAMATPVIGQQLYYEGGDVTVTVLPYSASYTSNLYLFSTGGGPVFIANSSQVGTVVDFFETALRRGDEALSIEAVAVGADTSAVGRTLEALALRQATGATVLAIMRDGNPLVNPPGDMALAAGDRLLALGTRAQLERVEHVLAGRS